MCSDRAEAFEIHKQDFVPIRLELRFRNVTAGTELLDPAELAVAELGDDGHIVLELPGKSCTNGHSVEFEISCVSPTVTAPVTFHATARVTETEKMDDGRLRATVEIVQYEDRSWRELKAVFMLRQNEITEFLKQAKG